MPIEPDTKDWTWVLDRTCPECGFDVTAFPREQVGDMIRNAAAQWPPLLQHDHVATRPSNDRWSALEYACHVRDVFRLYDERLLLMLTQDDPLFPNWDQDTAAIERRYAEQDPAQIAGELSEAGARLADRFDSVAGPGWERTGRRSDGATFTVETLARYMIHDAVHHIYDVDKVVA